MTWYDGAQSTAKVKPSRTFRIGPRPRTVSLSCNRPRQGCGSLTVWQRLHSDSFTRQSTWKDSSVRVPATVFKLRNMEAIL